LQIHFLDIFNKYIQKDFVERKFLGEVSTMHCSTELIRISSFVNESGDSGYEGGRKVYKVLDSTRKSSEVVHLLDYYNYCLSICMMFLEF